jgi:hypothetical protein
MMNQNENPKRKPPRWAYIGAAAVIIVVLMVVVALVRLIWHLGTALGGM